MAFAVILGLAMSVGLFFLLPMVIGSFFDRWISSNLGVNLLEGVIRMGIFFLYMYLISKMKDMKRLFFSYHGAEHKTIRCYEAKLPLTVENVRRQTRLPQMRHQFPRLVVMVLSILIFFHCFVFAPCSGPRAGTHAGELLYRFIMIVYKLLLLPAGGFRGLRNQPLGRPS